MNYVIARLKGKKEEYEKLYSGEGLYYMPDNLEGAVDYNPARILDDDEWYKLEKFAARDFCIDLLKGEFRTTDYIEFQKAKTDNIEYICSYQEENYFFQRIFKHNILLKKRLTLGDNVALDKGEKSIVINDLPDAVYRKDIDVLYFKKLQAIAPIFRGIDILYKEATQEETEAFLKNDFIQLDNDYGVVKLKKMNRKRIAMALETLNGFDKEQRKEVLEYTHKYYPNLKYDNKKEIFTIGNEDDLKYLLWGIEQRYYTTPVTNENRVANSVSVIVI